MRSWRRGGDQVLAERIRKGLNTISVTGNVLRDYLTDLFRLWKSGQREDLSVVPLIAAAVCSDRRGGSAPKHVEQIRRRTTCAGTPGRVHGAGSSLEHLARSYGNKRAQLLADTLDRATATFLNENKSPGRRVNQIDNRGATFYVALFWAEELAKQTEDAELAASFKALASKLRDDEAKIADELLAAQGQPADLGGYYRPDAVKTTAIMRPSKTLNEARGARAKL